MSKIVILNWADLSIGLSSQFEATINQEHLDLYSEISGDFNPMHTDDIYAKSKGFNQKILHGMLTSSLYSTLIGMYLPGKYCLLHGINISFISPVYAGDTLTISGEISYLNEAYKQVEIKANIRNKNNKKISKAKIKLGIME